ncbi:DoxX family protein [Bacillus sp. FJAT-25509]|uniref:DoxX family protein n=1 Tax=Bacillus sp. FJAT-25509 TaxID=1712029 RepID=UPI0006F6DCD9|nr:DoxX family protein [Bacillus sp. FJAT-25509]
MKWFTRIIQGILIIAFLLSGFVKLSGNAQMLHDFIEVYGYSKGMMYTIGSFEVLGAIGLLVGYWKLILGKLASVGLAIIMVGAVFTHLHAGQGMSVAMAPFILLVLTLIVLFSRGGKLK